jgi:hypothetical protein
MACAARFKVALKSADLYSSGLLDKLSCNRSQSSLRRLSCVGITADATCSPYRGTPRTFKTQENAVTYYPSLQSASAATAYER